MDVQERNVIMQRLIGNLLRVGVLSAACLVAGGGLFYLMAHHADIPNLQTFQGEPSQLTNFSGILNRALHGHSDAVIQLGLLVLILTPPARVVMSFVVFALEKDRLYIVITGIVLSLLLYGMIGDTAL